MLRSLFYPPAATSVEHGPPHEIPSCESHSLSSIILLRLASLVDTLCIRPFGGSP